jgi:RNA recognition motif-containing protein
MSEEQLFGLFQPYGSIENYKILKDKDTGISRGQGFVKYEDPRSAEYAISGKNFHLLNSTNLLR